MKLDYIIRLIAAVVISLLVLLGETSSMAIRKVDKKVDSDSERHKTAHKAASHHKTISSAAPVPMFNATNNTLSKSLYKDLNNTFVQQDLQTFTTNNRKWGDLKLYDKQLEDIYHDLVYQQQTVLTPAATRAGIQIFTREFEACDKNKDNVLSLKEFTSCFKNDTYLSLLQPPHGKFATFANHSYTNATGFYPILYNLMDSYSVNYTNFHDYMMLRLMAFSWRKCSVNGPFIDEVSFECAINIASGSKTLPRNTARKLYQMTLELSNTNSVRNIDFISYFIVAVSIRLYGKVNAKEDHDATKNEFNLALDNNNLPSRYNQDVIDQLFQLTAENDKGNQGVDPISFVFYDFVLRLFEVPQPEKRWTLSRGEFKKLFKHYLFPAKAFAEVQNIPQNNLTADSYQMYTYLNISRYHSEADHFLKFAQKNEKVLKAGEKAHAVNQMEATGDLSFKLGSTANWLFNIIDHNRDGSISFYDYGSFIQIAYLFARFDPYSKGRIVAGDLYEKYTTYSDFPYVSVTLRNRAKRFNLFPQDLYMDLMRALLVIKIDDIVKTTTRRVDTSLLYEVELKHIFSAVNLGGVPDAYLNKCLRGVDDNNIPRYDWECAFIQAVTSTSQYLESSSAYLTAIAANLTILNTAFVNVDPQLK